MNKLASGMVDNAGSKVVYPANTMTFGTLVTHLKKAVPELNVAFAYKYYEHIAPLTADHWAQECFPIIRPGFFSKDHGVELATMLSIFKKMHHQRFIDFLSIDARYQIKQTRHTCMALETLSNMQPRGDILIIPTQTGTAYGSNLSIDDAVMRFSTQHLEFGLGLFETINMIISEPNLLQSRPISCMGDVCPVASVYDHAPEIYTTQDHEAVHLSHKPRHEMNFNSVIFTGCILPEMELCMYMH